MFHPKTYLKILFTFLLFIGVLAAGYVYDFSKEFPPPITSRISFDGKLKFVREHIDPDKIDTLIVGSSIGLNNVLGSVLEKNSKIVQHAVNLSVYEATTLQVEQILELSDAFPNLKRIIYSAQYSDFPHARKYENYDSNLLKRFMRKELSPLALSKLLFDACNNLPFCYEREKKWEEEHTKSNKFSYLGFDHTGSVALDIYGKKASGGRWHLPHPPIMHPESFMSVSRMAKKAKKENIMFYVVHQPYRQPLYDKHQKVRDGMAYFDAKIKEIFTQVSGHLIVLQNLHLNDDYFADRTHLNKKGSTIASIEIAKIIDQVEKQ